MRELEIPEWQPGCPAIKGPPTWRMARGYGWLFLGVSALAHLLLILSLPKPDAGPTRLPHEITLQLKPTNAVALTPEPPTPAPAMEPALPAPARMADVPPPRRDAPAPPAKPQLTPAPAPASPAPAGGGAAAGSGPALVGQGSGSGSAPVSGGQVSGGGKAPAGGTPGSGGTGAGGGVPGGTGTGPPATPPVQPPKAEPKPPPPAAPAVDVKALLAQYAGGVKSSILRHKSYPGIAERLGHEGAVKVAFTLSADGALDAVSIRDSSGYDELDEAALAAVRAAAPFAALPAESGKDSLSLTITLKFNLDG